MKTKKKSEFIKARIGECIFYGYIVDNLRLDWWGLPLRLKSLKWSYEASLNTGPTLSFLSWIKYPSRQCYAAVCHYDWLQITHFIRFSSELMVGMLSIVTIITSLPPRPLYLPTQYHLMIILCMRFEALAWIGPGNLPGGNFRLRGQNIKSKTNYEPQINTKFIHGTLASSLMVDKYA